MSQIDLRNPEDAKEKIRDILTNGGSGISDIIWGPELSLEDLSLHDTKELDETISKITLWGTP